MKTSSQTPPDSMAHSTLVRCYQSGDFIPGSGADLLHDSRKVTRPLCTSAFPFRTRKYQCFPFPNKPFEIHKETSIFKLHSKSQSRYCSTKIVLINTVILKCHILLCIVPFEHTKTETATLPTKQCIFRTLHQFRNKYLLHGFISDSLNWWSCLGLLQPESSVFHPTKQIGLNPLIPSKHTDSKQLLSCGFISSRYASACK